MDEAIPGEPIQLEPFIHQVGGHSSMLCLDENTVCKPLIPRELHFYQTLPAELKQFTPEYKGIIEVCFAEDSDGYITVTAYPPHHGSRRSSLTGTEFGGGCQRHNNSKEPSHHTETSDARFFPRSPLNPLNIDPVCPPQRIRLRRTSDIVIETPSSGQVFEEADSYEVRAATLNPWVLKCHRDQVRKIVSSGAGSYATETFIVLENLTRRYRYPCILDLKMGIQQHGDDATPAKKQRQRDKVATTTSAKLGVRVCGMQMYQPSTGRFICRNKYYGRSLNVEDFQPALHQFLHDGRRLRRELLPPILYQLRKLCKAIESKDSYRFYTSSLLIIYDGVDTIESSTDSANKSELTRSHSMDASTKNGISNNEPKLNLNRSHPYPKENGNTMRRVASVGVKLEDLAAFKRSTWKSTYMDSGGGSGSVEEQISPKVDVRMIDFAHSTHKGLGDSKCHLGPDRGYIFGLENLIATFKAIEQECD